MNNKIVTQIDTNLISMKRGDITEENIVRNELLIKELIESIRKATPYVSTDDAQKLVELRDLKVLNERMVRSLQVQDIYELERLVPDLMRKYDKQLNHIAKCEADILEMQAQIDELNEQKLELQNNVTKLQNQVETLTEEKEDYKLKYEGQKNRKIVRLVDKVVR
ncbi:hypothetical protein RZE82_09205 [Mollicutes bacterium LVI A0039]|nr:hypothetical protein RZE82_09205 [Mollicutes bacterium LVI A0039]